MREITLEEILQQIDPDLAVSDLGTDHVNFSIKVAKQLHHILLQYEHTSVNISSLFASIYALPGNGLGEVSNFNPSLMKWMRNINKAFIMTGVIGIVRITIPADKVRDFRTSFTAFPNIELDFKTSTAISS